MTLQFCIHGTPLFSDCGQCDRCPHGIPREAICLQCDGTTKCDHGVALSEECAACDEAWPLNEVLQ